MIAHGALFRVCRIDQGALGACPGLRVHTRFLELTHAANLVRILVFISTLRTGPIHASGLTFGLLFVFISPASRKRSISFLLIQNVRLRQKKIPGADEARAEAVREARANHYN